MRRTETHCLIWHSKIEPSTHAPSSHTLRRNTDKRQKTTTYTHWHRRSLPFVFITCDSRGTLSPELCALTTSFLNWHIMLESNSHIPPNATVRISPTIAAKLSQDKKLDLFRVTMPIVNDCRVTNRIATEEVKERWKPNSKNIVAQHLCTITVSERWKSFRLQTSAAYIRVCIMIYIIRVSCENWFQDFAANFESTDSWVVKKISR